MSKTIQRRAPEGGYEFQHKKVYRDRVWREFERLHGRSRLAAGHVMLLPSIEGIEIEVARKHGARIHRMHVVDANPAIVATLKKRYPDVTTYGVTVAKAVERAAKAGIKLVAANFDFTGCAGSAVDAEIKAITAADPFADHAAVAVTMLRGRETSEAADVILAASLASKTLQAGIEGLLKQGSGLTDRDAARIAWVSLLLWKSRMWRISAVGTYPSGRQTMIWAVFDSTWYGHAALTEFARRGKGMSRKAVRQILRADEQIGNQTAWLMEVWDAVSELVPEWRGLDHTAPATPHFISMRKEWNLAPLQVDRRVAPPSAGR